MDIVKQEDFSLDKINTIEHFRRSIMEFEQQLIDIPGSYGDANTPGQNEIANKINPLKHTFVGGLYLREIFMPAGQIITSGIHKKDHAYFVQKGDVSILSEDGIQRIKAPYNGTTKPGAKRILYTHEDTIWITVHATKKQNVKDVLAEIVAKDFDDPDISIESMKKKLELKNK